MTTFVTVAQNSSPQTVADYLIETGNAPGAVVSIFDGVRFGSAAGGVSELEGDAARADQTFEIGSQTKVMTALVVLQLVEEGLIDLDQSLASYLDASLVDGVANVDVATVGQALAMKSGIPYLSAFERSDGSSMLSFVADNPDEIFDTEEIVALLDGLPAISEVGTEFAYSNVDYFYLSKIIEAVTGQELGEVFAERIFEPLGMEDTFLNDFRGDGNRLSGYLYQDGEMTDVTDMLIDRGGAGGVISTAADMATFMHALLVDQTLVSETVLATMMDFDETSVDENGFMFGNGLFSFDVEGVGSFIGFPGSTLGTNSATYVHVESERTISVAVNQSDLDISATDGVLFAAAFAEADAAWAPDATVDQLLINGISAANLQFETSDGVTTLLSGAEGYQLDGELTTFLSSDFDFTDGSRLALGSQQDDLLMVAQDDPQAAGADNQVHGFDGNDRLAGANGDDRMFGGEGNDGLRGGEGDDSLSGDNGGDLLLGGNGNDSLFGGAGGDRMIGGAGNDLLVGGEGADWTIGGEGADMFDFAIGNGDQIADKDVIIDFQIGTDSLSLGASNVVNATTYAAGTLLTLDGDGDTIFLVGVDDVSELSLF